MSGFDWIIAAIFLVSIVVGIMRGFIKESLSVVSWIVAIWLATTFCTQAGEFLTQYIDIPNPKFRTWAGFAVIFIGTLFLFSVVSFIIAKVLLQGPIKGTDRVLGIGFGALRASAIVVAIIIATRGMGFSNQNWWQESEFLARFIPVADYIEALFPEEWRSSETGSPSLEDKAKETIINNL